MVLIDFWTYTCINCIRTLPYVEAWDRPYRDDGLTVVGVHSPEFAFEKDAGNVEDAIGRYGISYPVVQDNDLGTWNAFANQYWPAKYLIDANGHVRYVHFGEGDYDQTEQAIRSLLAEAGDAKLGGEAKPEGAVETADRALRTPETYLGTARAQGWVNGPQPGGKDYGVLDRRPSWTSTSSPTAGDWEIDDETATAGDAATIAPRVQGPARVPRARLARRTAPGRGPARRQADLRRERRRRRHRRDARRSPSSASTGWSTCRRRVSTRSSCASTPASRATRSRSGERRPPTVYAEGMCRNIRTLHNFEPPATAEEIHDAALQYVRKISGSTKPSQANAEAFDRAVGRVTAATADLLDELTTTAPPKDREAEAAKRRARAEKRFATA